MSINKDEMSKSQRLQITPIDIDDVAVYPWRLHLRVELVARSIFWVALAKQNYL